MPLITPLLRKKTLFNIIFQLFSVPSNMDDRHRIDSRKKIISTIFLTVSALCFVCIASFADLWWETYTYGM